MKRKRSPEKPDKAPDGGKSHIGKGYRKISVVRIPFTEFLISEEYKGAGFDHFAHSAERWAKETLKRLRSPYAQGWYDMIEISRPYGGRATVSFSLLLDAALAH